MTIEIGHTLAGLGFFYLILKYLLPVVLALLGLVALLWLIVYITEKANIDFGQYKIEWIIIVLAVGLILWVVSIT